MPSKEAIPSVPPAPPTPPTKFAHPRVGWLAWLFGACLAGVAIFEMLGISVFRTIGMPHEYCYLRDPALVWLHVTADLLIGLAYVSISATLGYLVFKARRGIPFHWVLIAFGLFIISCGLTHFMEVWVIWSPVYWLSGYVKVITALASVATAVVLFPLVPKVFALIHSAAEGEKHQREIEQLNHELERFNYSVAHDLRAPLRSINGFGQFLREDFAAQLPAPAVAHIQRMQDAAVRMDDLITALLKYATVGRQALQLRPVALDEIVRTATALLAEDIRSRRAQIVLPAPLPSVLGDATLLQVIFQNLIGNAVKFVAPDVVPRVEITAQTTSRLVTVLITDNGLGIPPNAHERIFGIFERFHPQISGTGIGLPIVQRAVERLGGKIGVTAAAHGTGSQFWIELPAA